MYFNITRWCHVKGNEAKPNYHTKHLIALLMLLLGVAI
jgi:hypothetical protein